MYISYIFILLFMINKCVKNAGLVRVAMNTPVLVRFMPNAWKLAGLLLHVQSLSSGDPAWMVFSESITFLQNDTFCSQKNTEVASVRCLKQCLHKNHD